MSLICPACRKVRLDSQTDPGTGLEIDVCPQCYGIWFDSNELGTFFKSSQLKRRFFIPEEAQPLASVGYVMTTRARACPRCKRAMSEKLFGDVSIDICPQCQGIWLDDGELQRIVIQYKKGARDEKTVSEELSKGFGTGGGERASFGEVMEVLFSFLGLKK